MAKKGQKFKKIPLEDRLNAVKAFINEGKSYRTIAQEYGVTRGTVNTWVRIYRRDGGLDIQKKGRPTRSETRSYKERYEILKKYLAFLEQEAAKKK